MDKALAHEKILTDGLKEGNEKIFDHLFHYYYSGLVVFSYKYVEDMAVAEDLVQDFFFHLWFNRQRLDIRQSIKSYVFTSVKNKSLDYLKHREIRQKASKELSYLQQEKDRHINVVTQFELEEHIENALRKLPDKCRKVFLMNRFEGIKPTEIARLEKISIRTVEGHIGKAIRLLRKELKPYYPDSVIMLLINRV